MTIAIPQTLLLLSIGWVGIGTVIASVAWFRLLVKWRSLPEDRPVHNATCSPELPGGLTKSLLRETGKHFLFGHGAGQLTFIFIVVSLYVLYQIVVWPITLYKVVRRGGNDDDDNNDGDTEIISETA